VGRSVALRLIERWLSVAGPERRRCCTTAVPLPSTGRLNSDCRDRVGEGDRQPSRDFLLLGSNGSGRTQTQPLAVGPHRRAPSRESNAAWRIESRRGLMSPREWRADATSAETSRLVPFCIPLAARAEAVRWGWRYPSGEGHDDVR
jgi:hypothetical protein